MAERPRVFTISAAAPFLPTLIAALAQGRLVADFPAATDPLALAAATIYLPTQRAVRAARETFLAALGREAAVLPRLVALGDIDEDELIFAEAGGADALELPPRLEPMERRLLLAQLVLAWSRAPKVRGIHNTPLVAHTPAAALGLADALARLIDDMITREVPWERLDKLVPDDLEPYWQFTLEFLQIARTAWPALLAERGVIEPAARRDALIAAEVRRLAASPDAPVIAAGSTASMPSTAALLAAIARMPHGAVVLPGLDLHLDEPSWRLIPGGRPEGLDENANPAASHPQFAMQAFLDLLGMRREEVVVLGDEGSSRERLVSEAMRPAAASERWAEAAGAAHFDDALDGVAVIEAANAEEEALACAVALREAVHDGRSAALVTPDRTLARRVIAALARWDIVAEDSAGESLADTPAGVFARLAAETALGGFAPVTLLALLKHPLLRLGRDAGGHATAIALLERALLRGPRPRSGSAGLADALATLRASRDKLHRRDPRYGLRDGALDAIERVVVRLTQALNPLETLTAERLPLATLAALHRQAIDALADCGNDHTSLAGDDSEALAQIFDAIAESGAAQSFVLHRGEYADVFHGIVSERRVRYGTGMPAQVHIYGLLEARLQQADRVVLGGLVEGVWPPQARSDPWLSRPMRQELGLDLPERRIGLTAHDFAQALGARDVILSRPSKLSGAPTVASRFVQRLAAVAGKERWAKAKAHGDRYTAWARLLDRAPRQASLQAPAPKPPLAVRPKRLSVTEIEHWLRDPYTIYAKHILRLAPLDPVDTPPGARDRGTAIHAAIAEFTELTATQLPDDPLGLLMELGEKHFAPLSAYPEARAFWWPRFKRIACWFAEWERQRRGNLAALHAETRGELEIPMGDETFTLTGIADRIEIEAGGAARFLDYKTGRAPTDSQVRSGLAPQLTLEAAIWRHGRFANIAASGAVAGASYVQLRGGEPAGEECKIEFKNQTAEQCADTAFARLSEIVRRFANPDEPYRSLVHPLWANRYGPYDHLARVKEWQRTGGEEDLP